MDTISLLNDHRGLMTRPPRTAPKKAKQFVPIYLAEWLERLGVRPVELVKAEIINEGYLSQLRNGHKVRPSPGKLQQIGDFLGITWTMLYQPPPPAETIEKLEQFDAKTLARIMTPKKRSSGG